MSRPRGFAAWRPQKRTLPILEAIRQVLEEYRAHLPLTIRQVFYRLVGKDLIGKSQAEYKKLIEIIGRARRAKGIPMDSIRDDGVSGSLSVGSGFDSPDEWIGSLIDSADAYYRDRQAVKREKAEREELKTKLREMGGVPSEYRHSNDDDQ